MENRSVALIHTGAVVIGPTNTALAEQNPGIRIINYLDDKIVADLSDAELAPTVPQRLVLLVEAAKQAGAEVAMFTCSSISELVEQVSAEAGLSVLRVDEAMADEAVSGAERVAVLATLPTTCGPTVRLVQERARLIGKTVRVAQVVVPDAFEAVVSGDKETHDQLVAGAISEAAKANDVVVLAQASMASAAEAVQVDVPVLTSIAPGIGRLTQWLEQRREA